MCRIHGKTRVEMRGTNKTAHRGSARWADGAWEGELA